MKKTLLELVQDILSDMDSDEVNGINDTVESAQVAQIVRATYEAMLSNRDWPHLKRGVNLTPFSDPAFPTHVTVPDNIKRLISINYNKIRVGETRKNYQPVDWVDPDDFLRMTNAEDSTSAKVDVITDPSGIELLIRNDKAPTKFTSFDDKTLVFNSYDSSVDSSIQSSKIQARAYVFPTWSHVNSFVPDLPAEAFTALLEEAKSRAMIKLKQVSDPKAEQEARRQQSWLSRNDWVVNGGIKYPNYGRKSRKGARDITFRRD